MHMHSMQAQGSFGVRRGRPDVIEMLIRWLSRNCRQMPTAVVTGGGLKPGGSAVNTQVNPVFPDLVRTKDMF